MYKNFFGLNRNPFEISPDPYFLFSTERHNEAVASIYYGIRRRKGFVVMTGEVGTGKTLLVRCLLELLVRQQFSFANVFTPLLSGTEFLRYVVGDLGLKPSDSSKSSLLLALNEFLIARYRKGLTTVLIVDEAQHVLPEVLEEIRLLTNLETSQEKLLQILLVGQPELEQRLDSPELRQLKQRIALRCRLEPLGEQDTRNYIVQRLRRAGMTDGAESVFPAETIQVVYQHSHGIPRLINTLCENTLVAAFARQVRSVPPELVQEISAEFCLEPVSTKPSGKTNGHDQQAATRTLIELLESLQRFRTRSVSATPVPFL
jgi:type II secretory pathway predicted ATPase ExeA